MARIEFFKATSGGKIEPIEKSQDSLHHRRSIVIKDPTAQKIWLIHGSNVASKTKQSAENNAKRMNAESGFQYNIINVDYEEAEEVIIKILSQPEEKSRPRKKPVSKTESKKAPIPQIPKIHSQTTQTHRPKADNDLGGPIIKEFQIAYYKENVTEGDVLEKETVSTQLLKDVLVLVSEYIKELDIIINTRPNQTEAENTLNSISKTIMDLIY